MSKHSVEPSPAGLSRHELPGFGLPVNFTPYLEKTEYHYDPVTRETTPIIHPAVGDWGPLFPNALDDEPSLHLITLREFLMMRLMNQLTDKPDWDTKIFREDIVAKWKAEALGVPDMTERMFAYCIEELRYKSKIYQEKGMITAYDGDVVKSDLVISSSLKEALRNAVAPLERVPETRRDWRPDSNQTVLDLVNPSLFPVIYGRTRILSSDILGLDDCLKRCGGGETLPIPPSLGSFYSQKFQWLPCEVKFHNEMTKISSYINNLHPQRHKQLYEVIEQIIGLTIPVWNQVLTPLTGTSRRRIKYTECEYDADPDSMFEEPPPHYDKMQWEQWSQRLEDTRRSALIRPEPNRYNPPHAPPENIDLKEEFGEKGLQIIVKLANIHLTPEKPAYAGGTWHVDGRLNEHICATALYYYDCSNVTESVLSFRQQSPIDDEESEITYPLNHSEWLSEIFGCEQDGPAVQYIGNVVTKEGRLLAFPNVFQHRVDPFELVDATKPGHKKILALFLVDPHITIISSAHVPCQQKEWWAEELSISGALSVLPNELIKEVVGYVEDFPINLDEAKELRLELMVEKSFFVRRHNDKIITPIFSLAEY